MDGFLTLFRDNGLEGVFLKPSTIAGREILKNERGHFVQRGRCFMEHKNFSEENRHILRIKNKTERSANEIGSQNLGEMNAKYMQNYEFIRQTKINKWLLVSIFVLCIIMGVQAYFLSQKSNGTILENSLVGLPIKDPFSQNFSLDKWDPFEEFQKMQKRMDEFFRKAAPDFNDSFPNMKGFSFGGPFSQQYDLKEDGNRYMITMALPGLDKSNVNVSVEEQTLRVSGKLELAEENKWQHGMSQSRRSSRVERYMTLPGPVKPETLDVAYVDNTLTIKIDKK